MHNPFRKVRPLVERQHDLISHYVIDKSGAHCSRITEIVHLDRRGSIGENRRTCTIGDALQVDHDVGLEVVQ